MDKKIILLKNIRLSQLFPYEVKIALLEKLPKMEEKEIEVINYFLSWEIQESEKNNNRIKRHVLLLIKELEDKLLV